MKKFIGIVKSTKMQKTVGVDVVINKVHPVYKKRLSFTKRFLVDANVKVVEGDKVEIVETKPISKRKNWKIIKVIK
ncbi:30S ribosomal protein S17 [candidate division WWE3 bacterium CG10_big_fil_rev_8_21_14_0_10_32_10]|uniref:30S ribosomal protein S17 n=1 Tax=candidate division WWE3 bacterium CG10_big_fil_rev_8_21_14_0_10_32_10 TaxID=1975090 RepID=A0A2H0RB28_UNCKA|nr:MAG: 30S ribosomal protein S17 [candidate division WWE3 bacterium CG10_big_fil_rev_8_21_14_0_10_32_10]